jgi:hypothetical protein
MRLSSDVYIKTYEMIILIAKIWNFDSNIYKNNRIKFGI